MNRTERLHVALFLATSFCLLVALVQAHRPVPAPFSSDEAVQSVARAFDALKQNMLEIGRGEGDGALPFYPGN
ncbi:hypothetical protein [Bosea sp. 117]|uniref:hypothetical protein n=1 Tax=Bosea sp. 117 TaxID=1125973 RepID=UPI000494AC99|nr:hypothetical protein [Bosea sp. 117]